MIPSAQEASSPAWAAALNLRNSDSTGKPGQNHCFCLFTCWNQTASVPFFFYRMCLIGWTHPARPLGRSAPSSAVEQIHDLDLFTRCPEALVLCTWRWLQLLKHNTLDSEVESPDVEPPPIRAQQWSLECVRRGARLLTAGACGLLAAFVLTCDCLRLFPRAANAWEQRFPIMCL